MLKRAFDIFFSLLLILLLLIPFLLIALIIKLDSAGSIIFKQHRVGKGARVFLIYKFRTMYQTAPELASADLSYSGSADEHITRVGRLLRKTSLDELPQLFNVLKGDMSFIGPRPLIRTEADMHRLREMAQVYSIRPGLTGWAQINGRDFLENEEKIALDAEYLHNRSLFFDILIILRTFGVVLRQTGIMDVGTGKKAI
ncbi:MAG: sugar transferase [Oscillospiraceae bacterium]|nr:sugar transferase [Oscillospiraceae bacterium]